MKALVAVKRVVDYNVKVRVKTDHTGVETANVKMSMNPFDEIAVEEALRLRRGRYGRGGDRLFRRRRRNARRRSAPRWRWAPTAASWCRPDVELQPLAVAKLLKAVIEKEGPEIVIIGKQAIDDDCNQTGQMVAALLGWPQATFASKLVINNGSAEVIREVDGGLETVKLEDAGGRHDRSAAERAALCIAAQHHESKEKADRDDFTPDDLGVDVAPRLKTLKVEEPAKRQGGGQGRLGRGAGRRSCKTEARVI